MSRLRRARTIVVLAGLAVSLIVASVFLIPTQRWSESGSQGTTPLCFARTSDAARALIAEGADPKVRSDYGVTPLHFAAGRGDWEVVEVLIAAGADVNAKDDTGYTPLHWTTRESWDPDEGKHYIAGPFDPQRKLHVARLLVEHGARVNAAGAFGGQTPLFDAARTNVELTRFLLDSGASADARTSDGYAPLHQAMNSEVVRLLIEHGAKVNARDVWEHRTPLYFAHEPDVIEELTKAGGTK